MNGIYTCCMRRLRENKEAEKGKQQLMNTDAEQPTLLQNEHSAVSPVSPARDGKHVAHRSATGPSIAAAPASSTTSSTSDAGPLPRR
eukprot:m.120945 g.120945  ORF g.120945 m.120945 type:complete len:87 (+) comp21868_c1_seq2:190-450(+)